MICLKAGGAGADQGGCGAQSALGKVRLEADLEGVIQCRMRAAEIEAVSRRGSRSLQNQLQPYTVTQIQTQC